MIELLKKLDKQKSIDINKEIKNLDLENNQVLLISRYIVENNKAVIREAYEVQNIDNNDIGLSEELLEIIKNIKNKEYISGIDDINLVQLLNRGISKAIENIKSDYSLSELISETYLSSVEFYNLYFNTIDEKIVFEVFDVYITIIQLQIQNKKSKEFFYNSMGLALYAIIKKELKENELKDIISKRGITEDYYNYLHSLYCDYEIDIEDDSFEEATKAIKDEYDLWYNSFLFDYIDTSIFIDYLELNGIKSKIKETDKEIQKLLARVSEFEY